MAVGTIDPLYLIGEGAGEGGEVPKTGFGNVLVNAKGHHEYTVCEIKGVTDGMEYLWKGTRFETEG